MLTADRLRQLLDYDPATGIFRWRVSQGKAFKGAVAGTINADGYRLIGIEGRRYYAQRLAWLYVHGRWPRRGVDHRNLRPDDNWLANLRECGQSQNGANQRKRKNNSSGFKGVTFNKNAGRWLAQIMVGGKNNYLGLFATAEAAHAAYLDAARRLQGEFARSE